MELLKPLEITNAMLTSSIPERTMQRYSANGVYGTGDIVKGDDGHAYQSVTGIIRLNWTSTFFQAGTDRILWNLHGLANNTPVMFRNTQFVGGVLESDRPYWVINQNSTSFQLAAIPSGSALAISNEIGTSPINCRGNSTGHALSNPTYWTDLGADPDPASWYVGDIVVRGERRVDLASHNIYQKVSGASAIVTISAASPAKVLWNSHGRADGEAVAIETTGTLPTGLNPLQRYYVRNPGLHDFELSLTPGGSSLNTSGAGSGVHTMRVSPVNEALDDIEAWALVGPNNRWAMLDNQADTQTLADGTIEVTISPAPIDGFILTGIDGTEVELEVTLKVSGVTQYTATYDLDLSSMADWEEAFRGLFTTQNKLASNLIPYYAANAALTIKLTGTGALSLGGLMVGPILRFGGQFGGTLYGVGLDAVVYGDLEPNQFGITTLNIRRQLDRGQYEIVFPNERLPMVVRALKELRGQVIGFIPTTEAVMSPTIITGVLKEWAVVAKEGPSHSRVRITALEF